MAASRGKILRVLFQSGATRPQYSRTLSGGAAAFYDLPAPKPPERTVMVRADAAVRVSQQVDQAFREPILVVHSLDQLAETQLAISNRLLKQVDVSVHTQADRTQCFDTAIRIARPFSRSGDTAQHVGRPLTTSADQKQTIYHVLIDQSHAIAT